MSPSPPQSRIPPGKRMAVAAGHSIFLFRLPGASIPIRLGRHNARRSRRLRSRPMALVSRRPGKTGPPASGEPDGHSPGAQRPSRVRSPGWPSAPTADSSRLRRKTGPPGNLGRTERSASPYARPPEGRYVGCVQPGQPIRSDREQRLNARLWNVGHGWVAAACRCHIGTVRRRRVQPGRSLDRHRRAQAAQLWGSRSGSRSSPSGDRRPVGQLTSAVFDPTSRIVLAASKDGTVRTYTCASAAVSTICFASRTAPGRPDAGGAARGKYGG